METWFAGEYAARMSEGLFLRGRRGVVTEFMSARVQLRLWFVSVRFGER